MMETKEEKAKAVSQITVSQIIEEVKIEICDNYCRYPKIYNINDDEYDAKMEEICVNCPLSRL